MSVTSITKVINNTFYKAEVISHNGVLFTIDGSRDTSVTVREDSVMFGSGVDDYQYTEEEMNIAAELASELFAW